MESTGRKAKRIKKEARKQEVIRIVEERQKQIDAAMTGDVEMAILLDEVAFFNRYRSLKCHINDKAKG